MQIGDVVIFLVTGAEIIHLGDAGQAPYWRQFGDHKAAESDFIQIRYVLTHLAHYRSHQWNQGEHVDGAVVALVGGVVVARDCVKDEGLLHHIFRDETWRTSSIKVTTNWSRNLSCR